MKKIKIVALYLTSIILVVAFLTNCKPVEKVDSQQGDINLSVTLAQIKDMTKGTLYYVSVNGDDSNPGTSSQPFRTIGKAASLMQPSDSCVVRSGSYREMVVPKNSGTKEAPIRYFAYPGENVTVSGADILTGQWVVHKNNIYKTNVTRQFNQLFINGKMMNEARWPNANVDELVFMPRAITGPGTDHQYLKDSNLPQGDWNGAMVHIVPGSGYVAFTKKIKNYVPGQGFEYTVPFPHNQDHEYQSYDPYKPLPGNSYYLFGSLAGLDSPGEWFLDTKTNQIYVWTPDGKSPTSHTVELRQRENAFILSDKSYIELHGFQVFAGQIVMNNATGCIVSNTHVRYAEHFTNMDGFRSMGTQKANIMTGRDNVWTHSSIRHSAGDGIRIGGTNNKILYSIISDVNYNAGYHAPVHVEKGANHTEIAHNTMFNTGRFHIYHSGARKISILYNHLYNGALLTDDCGSTYAWSTDGEGSVIAYNWVHGNRGKHISGIYLDNFCSNFEVYRNVVWDVSGTGIQLNSDSLNNLVYHNTILKVGSAFSVYTYPDYAPTQKGTRVINNLVRGPMSFVQGANAPVVSHNGTYETDFAFIPLPNSGAVNAGMRLPGYNDHFKGSAPDIGAYEYGGEYWIPGVNKDLQAMFEFMKTAFGAAGIVIDDFDNMWAGSSNGALVTKPLGFGGAALPVDSTITFQGKPAIRIETTNNKYQWWIGQYWQAKGDLSPYVEDGTLEFAYLGKNGGEQMVVGFRAENSYADDAVVAVTCSTQWQTMSVPIKNLLNKSNSWNPVETNSLIVRNAGSASVQTIWISDIRISTSQKAPVMPTVTPSSPAKSPTQTPAISHSETEPTKGITPTVSTDISSKDSDFDEISDDSSFEFSSDEISSEYNDSDQTRPIDETSESEKKLSQSSDESGSVGNTANNIWLWVLGIIFLLILIGNISYIVFLRAKEKKLNDKNV